MAWFEQLETHLCDLYLNSSSHVVDAFKPVFHSFFGEEHQTFRVKMFHNPDLLRLQLERDSLLELQSQDVQINPVQAVDDSLIVSKSSWIESENNNALSKSVNETQLQQREKSSRTKSDKHDTSSNSGTYITHAVDANIRPVNDQVPFAEVDINTTPDSTNMCHRGGEIDQDAEQYQAKSPLLKAEFLKTNDMVEKEVYNELSNRVLQLEKHCISLEISIQQKEENFQSNKPCKNQDAPEFCEFFEINDLKAQLQAKTTLICNLKNQIKSVKEASNEVKVKHDIDVLETINIELESSVAKLLAENENLNKENEHLKQTYKELYDSIKKTRIQTKDHNDSLIAQVNSKTVENADLKAQIQEKVFANVALKNELRKLKGNSMDTKFAKPSILGKPVLQPPRNQSVVRQPNAFKSEPKKTYFFKIKRFFASQVDVNNDLPKPVTPHYLPKVRESMFVKPHHVIASGSSWNSSKELYGSNDMPHKYYLEEAKKKTQKRDRNSKPRKLFDSCTSKADCKPTHGSNGDIFKIHECKQTLELSAGTSINVQKEQSFELSAGTSNNVKPDNLRVWLLKTGISQKPVLKWIQN
ncbi:hypothetical protein Tco_0976606 [Tanacetum coccineum]|uniref:Uncharacterized protein n=1 Tax=Tanacetum coccineum TaxID=301880 RepID=A0ABQ5EHN9_9ASTR